MIRAWLAMGQSSSQPFCMSVGAISMLTSPLLGVCSMDYRFRVYLCPIVHYTVPGMGHTGIHSEDNLYPGYILCDDQNFILWYQVSIIS